MPNIMLTYRCNLRCPYCFANEFVNRTDCDITEQDFYRAADFITSEPDAHVGLIGGEPTLHPLLETFIRYLVCERKVASVMVYTNGLHLERLLPLCQDPLVAPRLRILVNCNAPQVMGEKNYELLKEKLDLAFSTPHVGSHIKLGLNLYDNAFDYEFIKHLLCRYNQYQLRISLTVPDFGVCGEVDSVENFTSRKAYLLQFFREMDEIGVMPYYDCNKPPVCIWTEEEWACLCWYRNKYKMMPTNILDDTVKCAPVVDILPDLRAVRCFGMSDFEKCTIDDFDSMEDLKNYFTNRIDAEAYRIPSSPSCADCYDRRTGRCTGGCLGYKSTKLHEANRLMASL